MNQFFFKFLKHYAETDYVLRLKARFLFSTCLAILVFLPLTMLSTAIISMGDPALGYRINMPVILTDSTAFAVLAGIIYILHRGHFVIAAHLFLTSALLVVWMVMLVDPEAALGRLDTIAFLLALLCMTPLIITRHKHIIIAYTAVNIIALLGFIFFCGPALDLTLAAIQEYVMDNIFAMIIIGFAAYNIFSINKDALDRAAADIEARRHYEVILRDSEERYRAVVEDQTEMIFRCTDAGVISFANGAFQRYLKIYLGRSGNLHGKNIRDLMDMAGDAVNQPYFQGLSPEKSINDLEYSFDALDGTTRWTVWTVRALYAGQGDPTEYQAVGRDITEKKQAEKEQQKLEEQLRQAQKMESIGRLAGGVAHDFNNMLTAISGNIQLALIDLDRNKLPRNRLQDAGKAVESAASLTRQLLAFSRKQIIEPRILNLNQLVEQISKLLARLIGEDIKLVTDSRHARGTIKADAGQMEQIIINLAVNARDAMPGGGILSIETADIVLDEFYCRQHAEVRPGSYVLLAVSDTGEGMDEEVQRHLFEPFFTTKARGKGTGLGLATIYGAVMQNNGSIQVYSVPGKGTTFKMYFPRVEGTAEGETVGVISGDIPHGTEKILLVEDDLPVREFAYEILTLLGYKVIAFASAEEALEQVKQDPKDIPLLLTDVVLSGMNGKDLATEIVRLCPGIKVLYTSGYTENVIVQHGVLNEGIRYIGKPYSADSLARKIRQVLDA